MKIELNIFTNSNLVVDDYLYELRKPLNEDISKTLNGTYKLLERRKIIPRVLDKIMDYIGKFYEL